MAFSTKSSLVSFPDARHCVEEYAGTLPPTDPQLENVLDALGLALAEDLRADRDFPPFSRSTRDGYAVRAADLRSLPVKLKCVGTARAGGSEAENVASISVGECAEIMTGASVPKGTDAVVMVEYTEADGQLVAISRSAKSGENIVAAGAEAKAGDVMVAKGTRVRHVEVGIAAAIGRPEVAVHSRPRVAVLATGDELVDINLAPGPCEIRNSNSYSLAAQVQESGGEAMILPVARDDAAEIALLARNGLQADLLLLSGGVSMGKFDLVEEVLDSLGAEFFFTGVAIQPGKPLVFGHVAIDGKTTPFFGLPGNPVSTMVTFELFVKPVLDALGGAKPEPLPYVQAVLKAPFTTKTGLTRFLPGKFGGAAEAPNVEWVRWQGSGDLMAAARSNCYIVVPPDRDRLVAGDSVTILVI